MTFSNLYLNFQKKYGKNQQNVFFDLIFFVSKKVKSKLSFINNRNNLIDFSYKKFVLLCQQYFVKCKPLAHITKRFHFCDLNFCLKNKVLAPRENTEELTNDFLNHIKSKKALNIVDLCAGSGNIGITIKKYCPQHKVACIDKYKYCCDNIKQNCFLLGVKIRIIRNDVFDFLKKIKKIDYIISNPPYIDKLNDPYILNTKYESKFALFAKDNGLYFFKKYFLWLNKNQFKECWLEYGNQKQKQRIIQILSKYPKLKSRFVKNYLIIYKI